MINGFQTITCLEFLTISAAATKKKTNKIALCLWQIKFYFVCKIAGFVAFVFMSICLSVSLCFCFFSCHLIYLWTHFRTPLIIWNIEWVYWIHIFRKIYISINNFEEKYFWVTFLYTHHQNMMISILGLSFYLYPIENHLELK